MRIGPVGWIAIVAWAGPLAREVVPAPQRIELTDDVCRGSAMRCEADAFRPQVTAPLTALGALGAGGLSITAQAGPDDVIVCERGDAGGAEHYRIGVRDRVLVLTVERPVGVAHAAATLLQLVRLEDGVAAWPGVRLENAPDLPFRCFMVDIGRNPHGPEVLRQVVDAAWFCA